MKLKCSRKDCLYEWNYKGNQKFYASCPRCLSKVRIKPNPAQASKEGGETHD